MSEPTFSKPGPPTKSLPTISLSSDVGNRLLTTASASNGESDVEHTPLESHLRQARGDVPKRSEEEKKEEDPDKKWECVSQARTIGIKLTNHSASVRPGMAAMLFDAEA